MLVYFSVDSCMKELDAKAIQRIHGGESRLWIGRKEKKMEKGIRLSEKHGVNPAIPKCFLCGNDKNEIILAGKLPGDVEAPRGMAWDYEPCDECKGHMEKGIILISVDEGKTNDPKNPYRTGGWAVVTEEAFRKICNNPELTEAICKQRVAFLPDEAWDHLGIPRGES